MKKMHVELSLGADDSSIEQFFQSRLEYFKSADFIRNLQSIIPERVNLDTQSDSESGYQRYLSTLFKTTNLKYRPGVEEMGANEQCKSVLGDYCTASNN